MPRRDIDKIIEILQERGPRLHVDQIWVKYPGVDDEGIWNFRRQASQVTVSLESSSGMLPFAGESTGHALRQEVCTVSEAVSLVEAWLGTPGSE